MAFVAKSTSNDIWHVHNLLLYFLFVLVFSLFFFVVMQFDACIPIVYLKCVPPNENRKIEKQYCFVAEMYDLLSRRHIIWKIKKIKVFHFYAIDKRQLPSSTWLDEINAICSTFFYSFVMTAVTSSLRCSSLHSTTQQSCQLPLDHWPLD